MYDYNELIRVIGNVEKREERERIMAILDLKERCEELEHYLVESGMLDDWNRLKKLCSKAEVRLCVSRMGNESIGCVLGIGDYFYCNEYLDNGMICKCMSSGGHWCDYYGFTYETDKRIIWRTIHCTDTHLFKGFDGEYNKKRYETRIELLDAFINTYEIYRDYQLKVIDEKFAERIKVEDIIK